MTDPLVERRHPGPAYQLSRGAWLPEDAVERRRVELPADRAASALARGIVTRELGPVLSAEEMRTVHLLASELINNAVLHGGAAMTGEVLLHIGVARSVVRVEVCDRGLGFRYPDRPRARPDGAGGFGLVMVDRAASRWGVASEDGTCVWFELDRPGAAT